MFKYIILIVFFSLETVTKSAFSYDLTEDGLIAEIKNSPYGLRQLEVEQYSNEYQNLLTQEKFSAEFYGSGNYAQTKEKSIISFQPIFSPATDLRLGVRKNLQFGVSADASVLTNLKSSDSGATKYDDVSTTSLRFSLVVDLWKDIFGRVSKASLKNSNTDISRAKLQREVDEKVFNVSTRRLYWNIVANNESIKISNELYKTSQTQAAESRRRFQNSVAERDEVARYEALVSQRKGSILLLEYQREKLHQQLKNQFPSIKGEVTLANYNIDQTLNEVLECTSVIGSQNGTPLDFTKYDEVVTLLNEVRANDSILNSRYSDIDLKFYGTVKTTGVDSLVDSSGNYRGSTSGSFKDLQNNNRSGYELGLSFVIPFGSEKSKTKDVKSLYDEMRSKVAIDRTEARIDSTHEQLSKSVTILRDVIVAQKTNTQQLEIRLAAMKKKYQQARVTVDSLINDQDALLSSELISIDTKLEILNTVFDYLSVFTETPCTFNRIK